jgi:ornithine carbamoyltransferase
MKKDFISLLDFTPDELQFIIDQAAQLKNAPRNACDLLKGKSFALIFQKPSNRTRVSFETGIFQMGGNPIYLAPEDINLGKREPTADIARTLSRFVDGIVARVFSHDDLLALSKFATIPVINALSDLSHPCQILADMLTVQEEFGRFKGLRLAYIGDGNNICNSLLIACSRLGVDIAVATPAGYEPSPAYVAAARAAARESGAQVFLTTSAQEAASGAHVLYTDTWVSMGQEEETARRLKDFDGFQIDERLAAKADAKHIFLHCLPAHRGQEVAAAVIDGLHSKIFDEAENRLHAQKAVLKFLYS